MKKKLILLPVLFGVIFGITSCSIKKNINDLTDKIDEIPNAPHRTLMNHKEIVEFSTRFRETYPDADIYFNGDNLFNTVKSGKLKGITTQTLKNNGNSQVINFNSNIEFDLNQYYLFSDIGASMSLTMDGQNQYQEEAAETFIDMENNVLTKYIKKGDHRDVSELENQKMSGVVLLNFEEALYNFFEFAFVGLDQFDSFKGENKVKLYKEDKTFFADYSYTLEDEGIVIRNKIRYNADFLPLDAEINAALHQELPDGDTIDNEATSKFTITSCKVTKKTINKSEYKIYN